MEPKDGRNAFHGQLASMISPQDGMRLPSSFVSQFSTHSVQLAVSRARQHLTHPASLACYAFYLADISAIKIAIGSF